MGSRTDFVVERQRLIAVALGDERRSAAELDNLTGLGRFINNTLATMRHDSLVVFGGCAKYQGRYRDTYRLTESGKALAAA